MKKKLALWLFAVVAPVFAMTYTYVGNNVWRASNGQLYASPQGTYPPGAATFTPTPNVIDHISSIKTSTGSGTWLSMTNNSAVLSPGTWQINASVYYADNGPHADYVAASAGLFSQNGNDTNSVPSAALSIKSGISYLINSSGQTAPNFVVDVSTPFISYVYNLPPVIVASSVATTIFVVPNATGNNLSNSKISTDIQARYLSTSTQ